MPAYKYRWRNPAGTGWRLQRLRGLSAAVVEGTGSGSGTCCGWLSGRGGEDERLWAAVRGSSKHPYVCDESRCGEQCKNKEKTCQCTCCKKRCSQQLGQCSPAAAQLSLSSTGLQSQSDSQALSSDLPTEKTDAENSDTDVSPGPSISPETIAAVIVAIIVAIILLDLCIFRFPVGRNIRDFLVRKIPFCIAFYS
ncbi:hypothetical protein BBBOND_0109950 [Babesia bigemina]|uniref:Uncharacterized protein n=1 Tax=Babesia bigemina TaxID=5866 RepID=A0A061D3Q0_BABBI|nr:hypothetical protein BBBOND_0109950 [Babesia bigemina]CDR94697.1 hypothetical protein BBBOND_0109950 [Babesia bigemina]|eukprot:XP_012766883.1 hypothetical protein BBBOND_0109950 [Babesia bigemina]